MTTPPPWVVVDEGSRIVIEGAERTLLVAEIDTSYDGPFNREDCEADAALIVQAVNAHEALVQALQRIAERTDIDSNGEYVVRDQPALSASEANSIARDALTALAACACAFRMGKTPQEILALSEPAFTEDQWRTLIEPELNITLGDENGHPEAGA